MIVLFLNVNALDEKIPKQLTFIWKKICHSDIFSFVVYCTFKITFSADHFKIRMSDAVQILRTSRRVYLRKNSKKLHSYIISIKLSAHGCAHAVLS